MNHFFSSKISVYPLPFGTSHLAEHHHATVDHAMFPKKKLECFTIFSVWHTNCIFVPASQHFNFVCFLFHFSLTTMLKNIAKHISSLYNNGDCKSLDFMLCKKRMALSKHHHYQKFEPQLHSILQPSESCAVISLTSPACDYLYTLFFCFLHNHD